jgi:hypothetical protein
MIPPGFTTPVEVINYPYTGPLLNNFAGMNNLIDFAPWNGGTVYTVISQALVICPAIPEIDTVVCEPQGGNNPVHPPTYWYDVTPGGGTGRCDFHVQTFDSVAGNYSNWVEPAGWLHAVHKVGTQWWVSWWDPTCTNAIYSTFRFQFDNNNPSVWSDWVTTNSGTNDPNNGQVDSTANHAADPDGYGWHVHVPYPEQQAPDTCEFYKAPYRDYAQNGMPDFDQKQVGWVYPGGPLQWTHCGPVALANCLWWFDSKFEPSPVDPRPFWPGPGTPPLNDGYPLVQTYDPTGGWDDHDTMNVHPFIDSLAVYAQTNMLPFPGTNVHMLTQAAQQWMSLRGVVQDYTIVEMPGDVVDYSYIQAEVMRSEDLILLLGFWEDRGDGNCYRIGGHYVTTAGVCTTQQAICVSDPYFDANEGEPPAGTAHVSTLHNDTWYVSGPHGTIHHDKYYVGPPQVPCGMPLFMQVYNYPSSPADLQNFFLQNDGDFPSVPYGGGVIYTFIEYVIDISPCCVLRGDADHSGAINVSDLTWLVGYLFQGGPPPICLPEGDVDGDGTILVSDLTYLVAYLFTGGPPPVPCP